MAPSYGSGDVGETVPVLTLGADDGAVGDFAESLGGMMLDRAAQDLPDVEWNKYADGSAPNTQGGSRLDVPHILGIVIHGGPPDPQRDAHDEAIDRMIMRLYMLQAKEAQAAAPNEGQGTGYGVIPSLPESVGDIAPRDPLPKILFSESVQSFQEINDQKVAAGTYSKGGEIGSALSDGQFGAAWRHVAFEASDAAKAELAARQYLPASRDAQRLDLMVLSPIGAIASLATGALGGDQNLQDAALIGGSFGESVVGGALGLPRTVGPAQRRLTSVSRPLGGAAERPAFTPYRNRTAQLSFTVEMGTTGKNGDVSTYSIASNQFMLPNGQVIIPSRANPNGANQLIHGTFNSATGDLSISKVYTANRQLGIGTELVSRAVEQFGADKVKSITGELGADNLRIYNHLVSQGVSPRDAALQTPASGIRVRLGYGNITFDPVTKVIVGVRP